jgi:hypothetical protein
MNKIRISENAYFAINNNEGVILNIGTGIYFGLNEIGSEVWIMLEEGVDFQGIIKKIIHKYDVLEKEVNDDVNDLLMELESLGLVYTI